MRYIRFPLSLRNGEDMLHECGIEVSHETPDMPRSRYSCDDLRTHPRVSPRVSEGNALLDRVAADELSLDDPGFWSEWQRLGTAVDRLGPVLAEFDYMQRQLVRAQLNRAGTASLIRQGWRDLRNR
jgi:hypothetical protein